MCVGSGGQNEQKQHQQDHTSHACSVLHREQNLDERPVTDGPRPIVVGGRHSVPRQEAVDLRSRGQFAQVRISKEAAGHCFELRVGKAPAARVYAMDHSLSDWGGGPARPSRATRGALANRFHALPKQRPCRNS